MRNAKLRILARIFTASLLLSGCSIPTLPTPVSLGDLSGETGVLVGSITSQRARLEYSTIIFNFKNVQSGSEYQIVLREPRWLETLPPNDIQAADGSGNIFTFALPAGRYTYNSFSLHKQQGSLSQSWRPEEGFSIPFVVLPRAVNYAGEFRLTPATGRALFGKTVLAGGVWLIEDQGERDMKIFQNKFPEFGQIDWNNVVPTEKEVFTPLVIIPTEAELLEQID